MLLRINNCLHFHTCGPFTVRHDLQWQQQPVLRCRFSHASLSAWCCLFFYLQLHFFELDKLLVYKLDKLFVFKFD